MGEWWQRGPLDRFSSEEWEALCDGCGKCCLHKLEDEDDGTVYFTDIACDLLDTATCRCRDYPNRMQREPGCVQLSPDNLATIYWLPPSCSYRLLATGAELPAWHPLRCGDRDAVHRLGHSVSGRATPAGEVEDDWQEHIIDWVLDRQ